MGKNLTSVKPVWVFEGWEGMPDLSSWGVRDDLIFAGHHFWFRRDENGQPIITGWIDEDRARRSIASAKPGTCMFLNLEGPTWSTFKVEQYHPVPNYPGIELRRRLVSWIREVRPDVRVGFYGQPPKTWPGVVMRREADWRWFLSCPALVDLVQSADAVIPEIYPLSSWSLEYTLTYCDRLIRACRDIYPGVAIYPAMWSSHYDLHQIDNAAGLIGSVDSRDRIKIPDRIWGAILDRVLPQVDGAFFWSQGDSRNENRPPWDKQKVTRRALVRHGWTPQGNQ